MKQIDIYRIFHSNTKEYILFSGDHETFSKWYYILGHKTGHTNIEKLKQCLLGYNEIKLEVNVKQNFKRYSYSKIIK